MTDAPATPEKRYGTAGDYVQLLKPRIMMLVVFTAVAGLVAATGVTGQTMNPIMAAIAVLAVALGSGAAGAINMWYDSDIDLVMTRTSTRPIPSGAVPREEAIAMGMIMSGVSVLLMWLASNWLAAGLLAFLHLLLRRHLYDVAEALDAAEHRDRWRGGCFPAGDRLGRGDGQYAAGRVDPVRHHLLLDAAAFLGPQPAGAFGI
jgi:hypothetical protein